MALGQSKMTSLPRSPTGEQFLTNLRNNATNLQQIINKSRTNKHREICFGKQIRLFRHQLRDKCHISNEMSLMSRSSDIDSAEKTSILWQIVTMWHLFPKLFLCCFACRNKPSANLKQFVNKYLSDALFLKTMQQSFYTSEQM